MAAGFPTKANWSAGDVLTAAQLDDLAGTVNLLQNSAFPIMAGKNAIINGCMDFWTRGTSSVSGGYLTADRWYENASAATTFTQETTVVPTGSKYSFKMTAGATAQMLIQQAIETNNSLQFAGQLVTVSAQVQASVTTGMTINAQYSASVDNPASGAWTTIAATSGGTGNAVSGSFTRISGVYLIPSNAKTILFYVSTTSTVTSGVIVYIGQCQLELGSTATTFARAGGSIGGELALCQRYYPKTKAVGAFDLLSTWGVATSTTNVRVVIPFKTTTRVAPTAIDFGGTLGVSDGVTTLAATTPTVHTANADEIAINVIVVGATQYRPYVLIANNDATTYLGFSGAEL